MVELMAMEHCLEILRDSNLHNIIIEVDSKLIINLVNKIGNGSTPDKVSRHWRLLQVYQRIQSHLQNMRTLSFIHMRRTTNRLVNILANEGVLCSKTNIRYDWIGTPQGHLREECSKHAILDRELYRARRISRMKTVGDKYFFPRGKQYMGKRKQEVRYPSKVYILPSGKELLLELSILMVLRSENTNRIIWAKDTLMDPNYNKIKTWTLIHWNMVADKRKVGRRNRSNPMHFAWRIARKITRKPDLKLFRQDINPASGLNQRLSNVLVARPHRERTQMVDFGRVK